MEFVCPNCNKFIEIEGNYGHPILRFTCNVCFKQFEIELYGSLVIDGLKLDETIFIMEE